MQPVQEMSAAQRRTERDLENGKTVTMSIIALPL
jgi:hypothetical protein